MMKQIYLFLGLITLALIFTNCKSDDSDNSQTFENTTSTDDFAEFDLRPYEINASLMVPKNERASIKHQLDTYVWDLKMGKQTFITIHDWGTKDGFKNYLEKLKTHSETVKFIEKEDDFTVYTLTTGTSKISYHSVAQYEIDGINYLFESSSKGLSKEGLKSAVFSIKSVEKIN